MGKVSVHHGSRSRSLPPTPRSSPSGPIVSGPKRCLVDTLESVHRTGETRDQRGTYFVQPLSWVGCHDHTPTFPLHVRCPKVPRTLPVTLGSFTFENYTGRGKRSTPLTPSPLISGMSPGNGVLVPTLLLGLRQGPGPETHGSCNPSLFNTDRLPFYRCRPGQSLPKDPHPCGSVTGRPTNPEPTRLSVTLQ